MAIQVQLRGGTTAEHSTFTGAAKEVTVDTTKKTLVVHDGSTAGGIPVAKAADTVNLTGAQTVAGVKTLSSNPVLDAGTANGVAFLNGSKVLTSGSALTFDGSAFKVNVGTNLNVTTQASGSSVRFNYSNDAGSANVDAAFRATNFIYQDGTGAEAMRLTSTGLGIGTSSPDSNLHVVGTGVAVGSGYLMSRFMDSFNSKGVFLGYDTDELAGTIYGVNFLTFQTFNGSSWGERMRLDGPGNLLVGTTTYGGGTNVAGFGANPVGQIAVERNDGAVGVFNRFSSDGNLFLFRRQGTTVGSIDVTTTATSYVTSSDYRLKNTIAPMTGALAKVALLKPCTYKWNADGSDGQGFIAHELAEVVPGCVTGQKDATSIEQYVIEPERKVLVTRQRQKVEKVLQQCTDIECIDGVQTLCVHEREVEQPVFIQEPLFHPGGNPVMEVAEPAEVDEEGNITKPEVLRQVTVPVPVMEDYQAEEVVPAVMGERVVPAYQGIDTSFLVATLTAAIQELKAEFDAYKASHP